MIRTLLLPALASALVAGFAPAAAIAAPAPLYLVVDFKVDPDAPGHRRTVLVRAFDNGDADLCAHWQSRYPNTKADPKFSQCTSALPAEIATLPMGGVPKAYELKFTTPGEPGATYKLMYDMSTKDPQQVCQNLADYQKKFGNLRSDTRVQCWVPRG